jgi:hypothetical protein
VTVTGIEPAFTKGKSLLQSQRLLHRLEFQSLRRDSNPLLRHGKPLRYL